MAKKRRSAAQKAVTQLLKAPQTTNTNPDRHADETDDESPSASDSKTVEAAGSSTSPHCWHCPAFRAASTRLSRDRALLTTSLEQSHIELSAACRARQGERRRVQVTLRPDLGVEMQGGGYFLVGTEGDKGRWEFGLIQLGYEISQAESFGLSMDGTSHRGITLEGTHFTVKAASYQEDINMANPANQKWVTRVLGVEKVLDHTAAEQHRGLVNNVNQIVSSYAASPLAKCLNNHLTFNKLFHKLNFQSGDHTVDGKKFQALNKDLKGLIVLETLGQNAADSLHDFELVQQVADVPNDEVQLYLASRCIENPQVTPLDTRNTAQAIVQISLGSAIYDNVTQTERASLDLLISAGCGGHKDLNALVYGAKQLRLFWLRNPTCTPPVLLPNKANDLTIRLAPASSAASKKAVESSTSGAIKLIELAGNIFHNKNSKKGYQNRYTAYMTKAVIERYGSEAIGTLMHQFAEDICDGKGRAGANHMEANIIRGLSCTSTMSEVAALAVYGLLVSWLYLAIICGQPSEHTAFVDMLDLVDLHRRLPIFCMRLAVCPGLIFDHSLLDSELTLDGNSVISPGLLDAVRQADGELPYLREIITTLFKGCAQSWCQFTSELVCRGPINNLPDSLWRLVGISATNDANEGSLGSMHVAACFHPNISMINFSMCKRVQRNDTENFIWKVMTRPEDHTYIMHRVRKDDASGKNRKFNLEVAEHIATKVTIAKLRDQLCIFKFIVEDPELKNKAVWGDKRRSGLLAVVVAAVNRHIDKIPATEPTPNQQDTLDKNQPIEQQ
ncbi:hypothetical protein DFH08DRAFT_799807 [Mycena albidolilacea]|uniref:Uncharacterized protein n=1 Tax=Mycena albidolilacea TaxID=1033008 RepID=A0AAD7F0Q7_9AGAR|nr:hypothetical protein DFH08DRAFT_799807 [Mycena albidolilacea]